MRLKTLAPVVVVSTLAVSCATNPATGNREFSLMSEAQEIQLGQQMDGEVRKEMGVYEDAALQRYVQDIGMRLARASDRPNLPWHFTVIDSPAVNAFALPGGYIYLTRGIMPFLDNEAQLAGVLGHEIGHVTARHSAQQYTKATTRQRRPGAPQYLRTGIASLWRGSLRAGSDCCSSNTVATTSVRRIRWASNTRRAPAGIPQASRAC